MNGINPNTRLKIGTIVIYISQDPNDLRNGDLAKVTEWTKTASGELQYWIKFHNRNPSEERLVNPETITPINP